VLLVNLAALVGLMPNCSSRINNGVWKRHVAGLSATPFDRVNSDGAGVPKFTETDPANRWGSRLGINRNNKSFCGPFRWRKRAVYAGSVMAPVAGVRSWRLDNRPPPNVQIGVFQNINLASREVSGPTGRGFRRAPFPEAPPPGQNKLRDYAEIRAKHATGVQHRGAGK
jgi:hypothetical protein